jgi:hypothetical protein
MIRRIRGSPLRGHSLRDVAPASMPAQSSVRWNDEQKNKANARNL